jgi:hypothetical protein
MAVLLVRNEVVHFFHHKRDPRQKNGHVIVAGHRNGNVSPWHELVGSACFYRRDGVQWSYIIQSILNTIILHPHTNYLLGTPVFSSESDGALGYLSST